MASVRKQLQYQQGVKPLVPFEQQLEWQPQTEQPHRNHAVRALLLACYMPSFFFQEEVAAPIPSLDQWFRETELPLRNWIQHRLWSLAAETSSAILGRPIDEGQPLDGWYRATEQPLYKKSIPLAALISGGLLVPQDFVAEVITVDKWHPEIERPPRGKVIPLVVLTSGGLLVPQNFEAEVITVDKWHPEIERPPRGLIKSQWRLPFEFRPIAPTETLEGEITFDRWMQPTGQPLFKRARNQAALIGETVFVRVSPTTLLYTTTDTGVYRVTGYVVVTSVTASGIVTVQLTWTDAFGLRAEQSFMSLNYSVPGDYVSDIKAIHAAANSDIKYNVILSGNAVYNIYMRVEAI